MSLINPTIYICPVCGLIDFDNYEDDETCIVCCSKLINTKIPRNICGRYDPPYYRRNQLTDDIKIRYLYQSRDYSLDMRDYRSEIIHRQVIYRCTEGYSESTPFVTTNHGYEYRKIFANKETFYVIHFHPSRYKYKNNYNQAGDYRMPGFKVTKE